MSLAGKTMTAKVARLITTMYFGAAVAACLIRSVRANHKGACPGSCAQPFSPPEPASKRSEERCASWAMSRVGTSCLRFGGHMVGSIAFPSWGL